YKGYGQLTKNEAKAIREGILTHPFEHFSENDRNKIRVLTQDLGIHCDDYIKYEAPEEARGNPWYYY
ncbi:MAG: hypothetical protein JNM93_13035, partial [Bacteriovoracaceae bacterium]|nr:hypothetical protein [Bacteriovoracaceae bacterium]